MGASRRWASYDSPLGLIAKKLRVDSENVTHEPLPARWIDLILYLEEQEQKRAKDRDAQAESWNQQKH